MKIIKILKNDIYDSSLRKSVNLFDCYVEYKNGDRYYCSLDKEYKVISGYQDLDLAKVQKLVDKFFKKGGVVSTEKTNFTYKDKQRKEVR